MINSIIENIPLVIPSLAIVDMMIVAIARYKTNSSSEFAKLLSKFMQLKFNVKTPFYFNYWVIYIAIAIIISIILLLAKRYTPCKAGIVIALNIIVGIMVMYRIVTAM